MQLLAAFREVSTVAYTTSVYDDTAIMISINLAGLESSIVEQY